MKDADLRLGDPEAVLATSGESFFWARRFLGPTIGHNAARLYSFCRVLDDMADGDIPNGPAHLEVIQTDLERGVWNDHPVLDQFRDLVEDHALPTDVICSLVEGLMDDQRPNVLIRDEEELIQYAYKVAGTVGLLMCRVLNVQNRRAEAHAIDLGIAMQLTNIARDVVEDAKMGRRYLPASWTWGMAPEDILRAAEDPSCDDAAIVTAAVRRLLALAEEYYASGRAGLAYLPFRAHFSIGVAAKIYRQIGIQLLQSEHLWFGPKHVTSKPTKAFCTLKASFGLVRRLPHPRPGHDATLHALLSPTMLPGGSR